MTKMGNKNVEGMRAFHWKWRTGFYPSLVVTYVSCSNYSAHSKAGCSLKMGSMCCCFFIICARVANQTLYNHTDWFIVCSDIVCFQIHGCWQQKEKKNPIIFTRAVSFNSKSTNTLQIIRVFLFCRVFVVQSERNEVNCCEVHWEQSADAVTTRYRQNINVLVWLMATMEC